MSHCPGSTLEDWLTDAYHLVDAEGLHGSGIRRVYKGQLILTAEQFAGLVAIMEPVRDEIEFRLDEYTEEEYGSWRDYGIVFDWVFEDREDGLEEAAKAYLKGLDTPVTPGLFAEDDGADEK